MAKNVLSVSASNGLIYDLTALGGADWLAYNGSTNAPLRKNGGSAITLASIGTTGGGTPYSRTTGPTFNYTDGTSPVSGSTQGGIFVTSATGKGWTFTVPADTNERTLRVFSGIYQGGGIKVTATLSDGSAAEAVDTSFAYISGADPRTAEYIVNYAANSAGQTMTVRVEAINGGTLSIQGAALMMGASSNVTVPGAPTSVTATAGNASASVTGTAPASNGGAAITGYRATSTPGGITGTGTTLPVNVTGLANGTAYTFTLAAQNSAGYGAESAASNSVTPTAGNSAPTFDGNIANIGGTAGTAITPVNVSSAFADTDALAYSSSPAGTAWPSGLSINSSTGVISGTVASAGTTSGLRVRATDTASQTVDSNAFDAVIAAVSGTPSTDVPYNDPAIVFSPYTWDDRGTSKSANAPGAYAKLAFTGTSITAKFDVSALVAAGVAAGSYPIVRMVIDSRSATDITLTSANPNAAVTGLADGAHTVEVYYRAVNVNLTDRWGASAGVQPASALVFTGFTLAAGGTYSLPLKRAKNMVFWGDSITEGYIAASSGNPSGNNSLFAVAPLVARALDCEYGQLGYSAQGYNKSGNGGEPGLYNATPANSPINFYSNGRSRLVAGKLSPEPDYVFVMHGENGTTTSTHVQGVIDTIRAAAPNARVFVMVNARGSARAAITAGVATRASDSKLHLIDLGIEFDKMLAGSGQYSNDGGIHPNLFGNATSAAAYATKVQAILDGAAQPALNARTVTLTLGNESGALANLTGLKVSFYDEPTPDLHTVPRFKAANVTTNASGVMALAVQSTLAVGGSGSVVVQMADGRNLARTVTVA